MISAGTKIAERAGAPGLDGRRSSVPSRSPGQPRNPATLRSVPSAETCWTLIRAAADGDDAQREEFGRRYLPAVRAILTARWKGTPMAEDIDDAIQEVFVACLRNGGALERADGITTGFRAFLFGVSRNVALHWERTRARRTARIQLGHVDDLASDESGLSRLFDREYARAIVREAMATMEQRARIQGEAALRRVELLRERAENGKSIREIARFWQSDGHELHLEQAKAKREFRSALRQTVGLAERCAGAHIDAECHRLMGLLE